MKLPIFFLLSLALPPAIASPCDGIDRTLPESKKAQLTPTISKLLNNKTAQIKSLYTYGDWHIVDAKTQETDQVVVAFAGAEPRQPIVIGALWNHDAPPETMAQNSDTGKIKQRIMLAAKGMPPQLAGCFAWSVGNKEQTLKEGTAPRFKGNEQKRTLP